MVNYKSKGIIKNYLKMENPNKEQINSWWINYQWGMSAPPLYEEGHEDGFKQGIEWMIENGFLKLTKKGLNYIPEYDNNGKIK